MTDKDIYQQLAESIMAGDSKYIPELFRLMADETEAKIVLAASPPATADELSEKTGIAKVDVEKMLGPLCNKGLIFKSRKENITRFYGPRNIIQFKDATVLTEGISHEFLDLMKKHNEEEWPDYLKLIESVLPNHANRVIPVNISVEPEAQILAFEDIKHIVNSAKTLSVTKCTCRFVHGDCGKPVDVCIQVDRSAEYAIERGSGRKIDAEEALDIMRICEEEGLVHVADNKPVVGHVICNCCDDCCINWPWDKKSPSKLVAPSRFSAEVDPALCTFCDECIERCYFDAISMNGENGAAIVTKENCMGCGLCLVPCKSNAIKLLETRGENFIGRDF